MKAEITSGITITMTLSLREAIQLREQLYRATHYDAKELRTLFEALNTQVVYVPGAGGGPIGA